eukprot:CAMPEP_0201889630 /NCGR_PEP_ID=MMETSP0902-20130614/30453_1 /ASSEMBLY_ACC=CAM_ASM_000551 /TAXON_ID=420261 /ORGANISM="Thalassiosira antarctica, Strain CCMP982" /LENGTH=144 /DNA_ID=CAMNT_0048420267 /DNA_START=884 /DNA_END=1314 /DNA_ORIENTATION=+
MTHQYEVAKTKLQRYNFIVITEMLRDPAYVDAVERLFGVPGVGERVVSPWCEVESHYANERVPLVIQNETLTNLTHLNKIDIGLYHEMKDCLDKGEGGYDFPAWDPNRFETNETIRVNYTTFARRPTRGYKKPQREWLKKFRNT